MLSVFIDDVEWITFPQAKDGAIYPGFCARSHFRLSAYTDELFTAADMPFSDELARSVPKRRAEFLAGRCLAKQVLVKLGHPNFVLSSAKDRSPQWPENIAGSLSHNTDSVLCAAHIRSPELSGVGVDIETFMSAKRAESLWPGIVDEDEYHWLRAQADEFRCLLTLSFSAKESLFKALYPQVKRYFDFVDARMVALDSVSQAFELELLTDLTPQCYAGRRFRGTYLKREHDVTTFLCC
ncbi:MULTISPECIES: 4'-phosphopantetheinyl transferase family protein [Brenneria]|uniref:Enterobactin synthase component D n=1 Tax=Brenneria nigrifluens DSM 30175 = ATCC 13028 TaxID=1121120 RepID=A0A2U1UPG0_9GAMM|nr:MULTISPECIES: 4'-phosphopantetheinyl transferase superfamily protein [Brenneria]EHD23273.1 4'-phosphopantetheinyl transferase [Brenneria sp. EniD312]PWC23462.1 4'-phosphopantetheinyl transferase [Brenneria nigrifluens DSM 30175 = ATCC 13028]QCR06207.1 4'-phosphopantetheinyl transferase superfamily protein [Brenneria nigrifluens DSM 30175 = ATCC 13028]